MAKLLKLRRGTTSQHNSFTGAEGEVTIDTTKDTAVVHDGSTAGGTPLAKEDMSNVSSASIAGRLGADSIATTKIAGGTLPSDVKVTDSNVSGNLTITSADIVDGSIVNADVNASAAIAGTKISPNFGSQNVSTTGNITVGGTVDGVDVAALKTAKDSLSTTNGTILGSVSLAQGVSAQTQGQADNSTKVATTAYVRTAVANVVDSAPGTLDTLNELAAALGDDANFATTTATSIGTKLPKSGGQMTGNITMAGSQTVDGRDLSVDGAKLDGIESGATADQSASEILTLVKTVDGSGSGLDADLWDGNQFSSYLNQAVRTDSSPTFNQCFANDWFRVNGTDGIYWQDYGGGWQMTDSTWMRCYNGKKLYVPNEIAATGNVTAYYSDERLKEKTGTINDALSKVCQIETFYYKENDLAKSFGYDTAETQVGVSAQSVEKVMPEVVHLAPFDYETAEDGTVSSKSGENYKTVDYARLVPLLIESIKELKAEIDELKGGK